MNRPQLVDVIGHHETPPRPRMRLAFPGPPTCWAELTLKSHLGVEEKPTKRAWLDVARRELGALTPDQLELVRSIAKEWRIGEKWPFPPPPPNDRDPFGESMVSATIRRVDG